MGGGGVLARATNVFILEKFSNSSLIDFIF